MREGRRDGDDAGAPPPLSPKAGGVFEFARGTMKMRRPEDMFPLTCFWFGFGFDALHLTYASHTSQGFGSACPLVDEPVIKPVLIVIHVGR